MTIQIRKAERRKAKLRLGIAGPSGAGKTMSALKLAKGIAPDGKILMIDTERGSGDLYAHLFEYDIITLQPPYAPKYYAEAIRMGEEAGYDVIIIDSLSHAWADEGGLLDQADKLGRTAKNSYTVWADITPQHRALVNSMLNSPCHIIATTRSKQAYEMETYTDAQGNKKSRPVKIGMAPVQREGMEYEFTVFMDVEQNHYAKVSKDRTDLFKDEVFLIDEAIGKRILGWLNEGKDDPEQKIKEQKMAIIRELARLNLPRKTAKEVENIVQATVQMELKPENFEEIVMKLKALTPEQIQGVETAKQEEEAAKPNLAEGIQSKVDRNNAAKTQTNA